VGHAIQEKIARLDQMAAALKDLKARVQANDQQITLTKDDLAMNILSSDYDEMLSSMREDYVSMIIYQSQ
jgi:hypothetical protein